MCSNSFLNSTVDGLLTHAPPVLSIYSISTIKRVTSHRLLPKMTASWKLGLHLHFLQCRDRNQSAGVLFILLLCSCSLSSITCPSTLKVFPQLSGMWYAISVQQSLYVLVYLLEHTLCYWNEDMTCVDSLLKPCCLQPEACIHCMWAWNLPSVLTKNDLPLLFLRVWNVFEWKAAC